MLAERPCLSTGAEGVAGLIEPEFGAIAAPENDPGRWPRRCAAMRGTPSGCDARASWPRGRARERFDAAAVAELAERLVEGGPPSPVEAGAR